MNEQSKTGTSPKTCADEGEDDTGFVTNRPVAPAIGGHRSAAAKPANLAPLLPAATSPLAINVDETVRATVEAIEAGECPPLWRFGGETAFPLYEEAFRKLYRAAPLRDPLGRRINFPEAACWHICFKGSPEEEDLFGRAPRDGWKEERAARLGFLYLALTRPDEIRPSRTQRNRQVHLVVIDGALTGGSSEFYSAYVAPERGSAVWLCSAYPLTPDAWRKAKRGGKAVFPLPEQKK